MQLLADTTPLRVSPDFRRLWIGQAISFAGSMITTTALPYQVFHDTHSSLAVGLLGLAQLGPLLACALLGGAVADGFDKKKVLLLAMAVSFICSVALAANATLDHPHVWLLFVIAPLSSASFAMGYPVLRSLLPLLLEPSLRPAGYALQSVYGSFGMMAGPAIAGVLIGAFGLRTAYTVDAVTYVVAALIYLGLAPAPPLAARARTRTSVIEGLRFLRGQRVIVSTFAIDLLAMVFGMPRALFPALADRLGGGPMLYGLLTSAVAAGAFIASLGSGWTSRVRRQGRAVLMCVTVWGAAIAVSGVTKVALVVLVMLAVAGAADMVSGVFRSAIAADATPDELRGRVSGVELAVYAGGPVLGDVEAGVVGGLVGVPFAIVSGGIACVVGAVLFRVFVPEFATYEPANHPGALQPVAEAEAGPSAAAAEA